MQPAPPEVGTYGEAVKVLLNPGQGSSRLDAILPPIAVLLYILGTIFLWLNNWKNWVPKDALGDASFLELWGIVSSFGGAYLRHALPKVRGQ